MAGEWPCEFDITVARVNAKFFFVDFYALIRVFGRALLDYWII